MEDNKESPLDTVIWKSMKQWHIFSEMSILVSLLICFLHKLSKDSYSQLLLSGELDWIHSHLQNRSLLLTIR